MTTYTLLYSNDAQTTLAAGITAASPSLQVVSGGGALFPALAPGQAFIVTLFKAGAPAIKESILVTGRAGDNLTGLTRGWDGYGALAWNAGDTVALVVTASDLNNCVQSPQLQAQAGNYAIDTGSANAYSVTLNPPLNGHVVGMPIRWMATNTNTGPSTFNDGVGAAAQLRTSQGQQLIAADIVAGGMYESIWDGTYFQLVNVRTVSFLQVLGTASAAQIPSAAVTQYQALLAIATSQLTGLIAGAQIASNAALAGSPTTTTQTAGDSSTKLATTAFTNPGVTTTASGTCIRLPSGHKLQFGTANPNGGTVAVTYPVAFTSVAVPVAISVAGGNVQTWLGTPTLSGFNLSNTGGTSFWIAVGL